MGFSDVIKEFNILEDKIQCKEDKSAYKVLRKFRRIYGKDDLEKLYFSSDIVGTLFNLYFKIKGTDKGKVLEEILMNNGFNINSSIHNAIYHLLGNEVDFAGIRVEPTKFVGVDSVKSSGVQHILETKKGRIEVYNATQIFRDSKSRDIFQLQLPRLCYARTYDFIKIHPNDSKAVIMKMPNFFYDGHYHAYIERENDVIDIAANAYYDSLEEASKILNGEVVGKYTFDEIEDFCSQFEEGSFEEESKVYIMTAYNAVNRRK